MLCRTLGTYCILYNRREQRYVLTLRHWLACSCSGSVGEVVAKLTELKFYKELQLVCRVMHVQGLVLQYVRGGDRLFHPVRTAATRASSKAGSRTGRRSVTVGHKTTTTDYSGAKTVTFSDHFDASTVDGDHEHDPQDIIISRDPNSSSSSKRQFFFNGTYCFKVASEYVLYAAYTLTWYALF